MNDFEDRVRSALRTDVAGIEPEQLLHDVHRGAGRRSRRRTAVAVAASALVVAGIVGVAASLQGDQRSTPEVPPATQTPSPTQPPLPEGAAQGVIDVSVVSSDAVYRLTTNVGCVACSTVWRQDATAEGGWERLHDFGEEAYAGKVDPGFGPIEYFTMAPDGRDGWAWGGLMYSTHDAGRTWTQVDSGPGRDTGYGHFLALTDEFAWSLLVTDQGRELWRTPVGSDDWSRADAPDMRGVSAMETVGDEVALDTSDEGLAAPRLQHSSDGTSWSELTEPCQGENRIYPAKSAAFLLCVEGDNGATVYRTTDLARWEVFGHSAGAVTGVHPLADDRLLIIGLRGLGNLITPSGRTAVDLNLPDSAQTFESSSSGDLSYLTVVGPPNALLRSTDGGLTWHEVE